MGGLFGVTSRDDCVIDVFYGTDYHSHLGTRRGGLAFEDGGQFQRAIHDITSAQFRSKFEADLGRFRGRQGVGVISDYEAQPLIIGSHHGLYAIATVGRLCNAEALAAEAFRDRTTHLSENSGNEFNPTEIVASLISREATLEQGIRRAQEAIEGSCSMVLLTKRGLYAARDLLGRTPLVLGRREGAHAVTSETCALPNLGFEPLRDLGPGEVVRVTADGVEQLLPPRERMQMCAFLWIYYGYPASTYEGINVEAARNRCGVALARADDVSVDFVAGIPDSGIGHAIGYAHEARLPYCRPFLKYTPTWPRSFMPQDQRVRDLVAKMKLIPARELIVGKRVLFCEDSIVRGTQLRDIIRRLFDYGAAEIHMRPACPPLIYGCRHLNFSRSKSEMDLAARKAIRDLDGTGDRVHPDYLDPRSERYASMVEHIRQQLGLTSLRYQRLDDMLAAIGMPRERMCTSCWDGREG